MALSTFFHSRLFVRFGLLAVLALAASGQAAAQHVLAEVRGSLSPRLSDVVFSPRFLRAESHDVARSFGVTRAEWIYVPKWADASKDLRRLAPWVGLTLNSTPPLPKGQGYAQDFDGTPLVAFWMKSWGAKWVTTTHDETRLVLDQQLERSLAVGARSIQYDDPILQVYSARFHGGDFNPATQEGFSEWLRRYPDQSAVRGAGLGELSTNYREFLIQKYHVQNTDDYKRRFQSFASNTLWQRYVQSTVEDFFSAMRQRLHARSPSVALSMNVSMRWPDANYHSFFLTAFPDYLMPEMDIGDTSDLIAQVATARSLGLGLVPSIRPIELARNRVSIALLYALGTQPMVPWDVFVLDGARYFGTVEEYGDLYQFVRGRENIFDGHEAVATVAIVVDPLRFSLDQIRPFVQMLTQRNIPYAFVLLGDAKGRRALTKERLAGFKLVAMAVPESALSDDERALLASVANRPLPVQAITAGQLDEMRPIIAAPGSDGLRIIVRAGVGAQAGRWVVHVIDETKGSSFLGSSSTACRRKIGIDLAALGIPDAAAASWLVGGTQRTVSGTRTGNGKTYFPIDSCPLWGVLVLSANSASPGTAFH